MVLVWRRGWRSAAGIISRLAPEALLAIISGYTQSVIDVSIAEAKNRLPQLIRAVENGEKVVITRHGKPAAQIAPPPRQRRKVQWGAVRDRIKLLPGWDESIDVDRFLAGGL